MQTSSTLHHKYGHFHFEHFSSQVLGFSSDQDSVSKPLAWGLALPDWNEILFLFAQISIQITLLFLWNLSHFFYIYKKIFKNVCTNIKGRLRQLVSVGTTDKIIWVGLKPILSNSQPAHWKTKPPWAAGTLLCLRTKRGLNQWWLLLLRS